MVFIYHKKFAFTIFLVSVLEHSWSYNDVITKYFIIKWLKDIKDHISVNFLSHLESKFKSRESILHSV